MPQIIPQGDIFGRIGEAIGGGFSEQLPKEMQNQRIAAGLKSMEGKNLSPLAQLGSLANYGVDISKAAAFLPLIQQQQARQQFINQYEGKQGQESTESDGESPEKGISRLGTEFVPLQKTDIPKKAAELMMSQPLLNEADAMKRVEYQYETEQDLMEKASDEFENSLKTRLQKEGKDIDSDIIGDLKKDYEREVQALAASGKMSPEKAADITSSKLLDFAKMRNKLKNLTIDVASRDPNASLKALRKEYSEKKGLENFRDDLMSYQGFSPQAANVIAFPVSSEMQAKIPKRNISIPLSQSKQEKIFKNILTPFPKDQSILAISHYLSKKGYDSRMFIELVNKLNSSNELPLTPLQQREILDANKPRTLNDIFGLSWLGMD